MIARSFFTLAALGRIAKALAASVALAGCGGGGDASPLPRITAFSVTPAEVQEGASVSLMAEFSGGQGFVEPGVGAITSGRPVTLQLVEDTTYTLKVADAEEHSVEARQSVTIVYDARWDIDDAAGWALSSLTEVANGRLRAWSTPSVVFGGQVAPCGFGHALLPVGDAKMRAGNYGQLTISLEGVLAIEGEVELVYRNRDYLFPGITVRDRTLKIELAADGPARMLVDGVAIRETNGQPLARAKPPSVAIQVLHCPPGSISIDAVAVSAR